MTDAVLHDLRYAIRTFKRDGFFALITTLTLSLGIGVVTALFAIISAVLLHPIVADQERVVHIQKLDTARGDFPAPLSLPEFVAWRDQSHSFELLAAVDHAATGNVAVAIDGQTFTAQLAPVSADFLRVIHRGEPLHGRWFVPTDELPGADVAAVVSERFWRRVGGGDPAFVGRRLSWAGDRTLVVVGIAPSVVDYPLGTEIWAPGTRVFDGRSGRFDASDRAMAQFELLGRLAPGVSLEQAHAELAVIHRRVAAEFPNNFRLMQVAVEPLIDTVVGDGRHVLVALFAAAGLVFVIAGVNVAALLLMRASERHREVVVRVALGAGRARLLGQTVTEGVVLGALGAAGGLLVARALLLVVQGLAPGDMPRIEHAALDPKVLAFSAVAAMAWLLALGTIPVWTQRRLANGKGLAHGSRAVRGTKGLLIFSIAEIAAAVVVAIGAGLLVRTFAHLQAIDRGFAANDLLMMSLLLPESRLRDPRAMLAFYEQLLPQVEALPDVVSASPVHVGPGSGTLGLSAPMLFEGQTPEEAKTNPWATWEPVLPSYFDTLGIPVIRGRTFSSVDRRGGVPVAIVSESVVQRYWPGQEPLGKRMQFVAGPKWPWVTVVGVAGDTRYRELRKPWMTVYFPADQFFFFQAASLVVRSTAPREALVAGILERVRTLEPGAVVRSVSPMETLLARELSRPLTALTVTGVFALMAMVMAAVGVYGVLSYEVRQRRRELAVRAVVGATPARIFRSVVSRSLVVAVAGTVTGLAIATSVTRTLRSLLFEVQPGDPAVFLTGAGALFVIVLLAAYFPARRAAGTDPAMTLRIE